MKCFYPRGARATLNYSIMKDKQKQKVCETPPGLPGAAHVPNILPPLVWQYNTAPCSMPLARMERRSPRPLRRALRLFKTRHGRFQTSWHIQRTECGTYAPVARDLDARHWSLAIVGRTGGTSNFAVWSNLDHNLPVANTKCIEYTNISVIISETNK